MTTRPKDWPTRLLAFVSRKRRHPFAWAQNDCCLFASDWVLALTGRDPAADLRGAYTAALGAWRIVKASGGVTGLADSRLGEFGWGRCDVKRAGRGDVVAALTKHGPALGVCIGAESLFAGNFKARTLDCVAAWRTN